MSELRKTIGKRTVATAFAALLAVVSLWGTTSPASAAEHELTFTVVAVNNAPPAGEVKPSLVLSAQGTFTADSVTGGGFYTLWDDATEVPKTILSSGTWEATEVLRWTPAEGGVTVGHVHPGVVDLRVDLVPDEGSRIEGATLRINCNVGFAGIRNNDPDSGEPLAEGYWLTLPEGAQLGPTMAGGTFAPRDPVLGITLIGR